MIFIYNPETDYALADNSNSYTPSKGVVKMRQNTLPLVCNMLWEGDKLLLSDVADLSWATKSGFADECNRKGIELTGLSSLQGFDFTDRANAIRPWGWNRSLRSRLLNANVPEIAVPSMQDLDNLRELSHRKTTVEFNRILNRILQIHTPVPFQAQTCGEAMDWLHRHPDAIIKAPWSSSGRGVQHTSEMTATALKTRIESVVKHQGSIMMEIRAEKTIDFATEWSITGGKAEFMGFSLFQTRENGLYAGNKQLSQTKIEKEILRAAPRWTPEYLNAQKGVLEKLIAPYYSGPAGIDMLADTHGAIWPCIEINLRITMGHVAIISNDKTKKRLLTV